MAEQEYSRYQKNIIKRYYENRDQIDEQRLSELVTSLYLASPRQAAKKWEGIPDLLRRLSVPESRIEHIMNKQDITLLAGVVEDLQKGLIPRKKT
ncbi:MAG: hypothetical protein KDA76_00685 [Planctomycetaceae bacterium]|nr:hypothetical protein [Planctomycetaceae bacterium]